MIRWSVSISRELRVCWRRLQGDRIVVVVVPEHRAGGSVCGGSDRDVARRGARLWCEVVVVLVSFKCSSGR